MSKAQITSHRELLLQSVSHRELFKRPEVRVEPEMATTGTGAL